MISRKPGFGVVTFTVTVLALIAFTSKILQPYIEPLKPSPQNHLPGETADYLIQGSAEQINWRTLDDAAFAEARRLDTPILIVIGSSWSKLARSVDRDAFVSPEVQNYLNRNFELIRVDSLQRPDWMNAYLPVSRIRLGFLPGFQIWALTPDGKMFDLIARNKPTDQLDHVELLAALITVRRHYEQAVRAGVSANPDQRKDLNIIEQAPADSPNISEFGDTLARTTDPIDGGFPWLGFQFLEPDAWRFQLMTGRFDEYRKSSLAFLHSPMVDLLNGGFYRQSSSLDWNAVEYDKVAVQNADMMIALACAGAVDQDPLGEGLSKQAFDCLTNDFVVNGLIAGCQVGDEQSLERSARDSFSPRKLREIFPDEGPRDWVRSHFGLDTRHNPQATPEIVDSSEYISQSAEYRSAFNILRAAANKQSPQLAGFDLLDVNGYVVARLIECARIWHDAARMQQALTFYDRLERFRSNDDVQHTLSGSNFGQGLLSDYLSYADASLQAYLATGRIYSFDSGLAVLNRACFLYAGRVPGEFFVSRRPTSVVWPPDIEAPEIVDNCGQSCTARLIALCHAYGRLLGPRAGRSLLKNAYDATQRFGAIANSSLTQLRADGMSSPSPDASRLASYFCAVAEIQSPAYAVAVGPNAQALSDALKSCAPFRLIAPAAGHVMPDLQQRLPGIYLVDSGNAEGPYTVDQAATKLGKTLDVLR